ncbi:hypothetical protein M595_3545 [Lyngbya aestuarii BL J]|uniref:Uncharacterized protein n=1 Tax=Lyngbya aestuarii BL J TaxID=1348334 RepID=U7QEX8_9CYAN|nr:hypothetical protein [Lyngbya aestuarii]ERT06494.1 hypothetical protein M595_3545 [Lyngbya aestuarii BL J]
MAVLYPNLWYLIYIFSLVEVDTAFSRRIIDILPAAQSPNLPISQSPNLPISQELISFFGIFRRSRAVVGII